MQQDFSTKDAINPEGEKICSVISYSFLQFLNYLMK